MPGSVSCWLRHVLGVLADFLTQRHRDTEDSLARAPKPPLPTPPPAELPAPRPRCPAAYCKSDGSFGGFAKPWVPGSRALFQNRSTPTMPLASSTR